MALDKRLLDILCCPATKQPVGPLSAAQLASLNRAVAEGVLAHIDGTGVSAPFSAGLLTRDGRLVYRIDDGIPVLLADQGVSTQNLPGFPA